MNKEPDKKSSSHAERTASSSNAERAAEILLLLGESGLEGVSLSRLAQDLKQGKSTIHRTLTALGKYGFVEQSGKRGSYRLGSSLFGLANKNPKLNDLVAYYRPKLVEICGQTGFSCYLMVRAGLDSVCVDFEIGSVPVPTLFDGVGGRLPLGVGHAGISMLAFMDEKSREQILTLNAAAYDKWQIDLATIRKEIALQQRCGFVYGQRITQGVVIKTIAVPIRWVKTSKVEAALSLMLPDGEWSVAQIEALTARIKMILQ